MDSVEGDRQGLVALYYKCNGRNWARSRNWLTDEPIENWDGVKIDHNGRLLELSMHRNKLSGCLPREIRNWTQDFDEDNLSGSLPREIGDWTQDFDEDNLSETLLRQIRWTYQKDVYVRKSQKSWSPPDRDWGDILNICLRNNLFRGRDSVFLSGAIAVETSGMYTCWKRILVSREKRRRFLSLV